MVFSEYESEGSEVTRTQPNYVFGNCTIENNMYIRNHPKSYEGSPELPSVKEIISKQESKRLATKRQIACFWMRAEQRQRRHCSGDIWAQPRRLRPNRAKPYPNGGEAVEEQMLSILAIGLGGRSMRPPAWSGGNRVCRVLLRTPQMHAILVAQVRPTSRRSIRHPERRRAAQPCGRSSRSCPVPSRKF